MSGITFGFFAPLFLAIIGMKFSGQSLEHAIFLLIILIVAGILSKTLGGYLGARICKFPKNQGLAIATLLNGRGTVGLAYSIGILDITLFSVCVAICFITTVITPLIAKPVLNKTVNLTDPK